MATKRQVKKQESKLNAMKAKAAPVVEKVAEKAAPVVEKVVEKTAPAVEKVKKSSSKKRDEDDFDRRAPRKASGRQRHDCSSEKGMDEIR